MDDIRVIPVLLLKKTGLVKTVRFDAPTYVGDPINAIHIFNEKEVDELVFLDIEATVANTPLQFDRIASIASECFMPLCYGGGLRNIDDVSRIISVGVEKVAINAAGVEHPQFVEDIAKRFGSQSVVVSIDARRGPGGKFEVVVRNGKRQTGLAAADHAKRMENAGAGELLVTSVDRDGTREGYDVELIREVSRAVSVPVIACGGAGRLEDFVAAVRVGGASAVAAGSMFVFHGKRRAVLLSYPRPETLRALFKQQ